MSSFNRKLSVLIPQNTQGRELICTYLTGLHYLIIFPQDWHEIRRIANIIFIEKLVCSPKLAHENKRKGFAHVKKFIISGFQTPAGRGSASVLRAVIASISRRRYEGETVTAEILETVRSTRVEIEKMRNCVEARGPSSGGKFPVLTLSFII